MVVLLPSWFFNMAETGSEPSFHPYAAEENVLLIFAS